MKAVIIHERSFNDAFREAEHGMSHAVHEVVKSSDPPHRFWDAQAALEGVQKVLVKLKERLTES